MSTDKWVGETPLNIRFPRLFAISNYKDRTIIELGEREHNIWVWKLTWRRVRLQWETT